MSEDYHLLTWKVERPEEWLLKVIEGAKKEYAERVRAAREKGKGDVVAEYTNVRGILYFRERKQAWLIPQLIMKENVTAIVISASMPTVVIACDSGCEVITTQDDYAMCVQVLERDGEKVLRAVYAHVPTQS